MQPATATDTSAHDSLDCTPDAPCVACLAPVPANDAAPRKAPRSAQKRWTWKRLHREVLDHCAMGCDAPAALALVYVLEDDRSSIAHTAVAMLDLYRVIAAGAAETAGRTLADEPKNPGVIAFMASDLRRRAELLAGIAATLENHADETARKQGAGL